MTDGRGSAASPEGQPLTGPDLVAVLRSGEERALLSLTSATGGASVCVDARAGVSRPSAKYHEGAASALAEVRRMLVRSGRLGSGPSEAEDDALTTLQRVRDRWCAECESAPTPVWLAYRTGGCVALGEVAALVGHGP